MFYWTKFTVPLGTVILASDGEALCGLWFQGQKYFSASILDGMYQKDDLEIFQRTEDWIQRYFEGKRPKINELPLRPAGSQFRQSVWKILCEIPYGEVTTYGEVARKAAKERNLERMSPQAVGGAIGHNPISIIIPCHRVIGSDGSLTGYAGGIERKKKLLEHEGAVLQPLRNRKGETGWSGKMGK